MHSQRIDPEALPLYDSGVKAGFPSPAEDEIAIPLNLNTHLIPHPSSTFFIRALGDSMQGAGIFSGDILIVDKSLQASHGKIVVALIDGEFTVKRLMIQTEGVILQPENPQYKPIYIRNYQDLVIWGVVTYVIHKT